MKPPTLPCESYWTYRAPPTPAEGPPGFKGNWFELSPGMRREVWRDYERPARCMTNGKLGGGITGRIDPSDGRPDADR